MPCNRPPDQPSHNLISGLKMPLRQIDRDCSFVSLGGSMGAQGSTLRHFPRMVGRLQGQEGSGDGDMQTQSGHMLDDEHGGVFRSYEGPYLP